MGLRCIRSDPDSLIIKAEKATQFPGKVYYWFVIGLQALRLT